jgi:MFS family permease
VIARLAQLWWAILAIALWLVGTAVMTFAVARTDVTWAVVLVNTPSLLIVGLAIGVRRPEVRVGQLLALSGAGFAVAALMIDELVTGLAAAVSTTTGAAILTAGATIGPLSVSAIALALLLFPDGSLPSPRWRVLAILLLGYGFASSAVGLVFSVRRFDRPLAAETLVEFTSLFSATVTIGIALMLPVFASLAVRARRATGAVRRQVGWLAYGVGIYVIFLMAVANTENTVEFALLFFSAIPLAIWVAITRHGLYDLGRLVSRTVVYIAVVGALAVVYLGAFTILSTWLPVDSDLGVAASTLAAAAAFNPLRRRIQTVVDRRFFRTRYHTQEVFDGFAERVTGRPDAEAIEQDIVEVLTATLAPGTTAVWIRTSS